MIPARTLAAAAALVAASPAVAAKKPLAPGDRIDLNRAPVVELMRLPGVGRKRAEAIAAVRARTPFRRVEDVLTVKGVSHGWLEKHRAHLSVGAAPPTAAGAAAAATARPAAATPARPNATAHSAAARPPPAPQPVPEG